MFVARIFKSSITIEALGKEHIIKFDFVPGLIGYLPVFGTKEAAEDFLKEMNMGGGVEEIRVSSSNQSNDSTA